MVDLSAHLRTIMRISLFFFSGCLLLWAFVPPIQSYVAGLLLGTIASLINARILAYKIHQITQAVIANDGKRVSAGFLARISISLIAVMASLRFPQFELVTTIIGLFFAQMATLLMGFISIFKKQRG